MSGPSILLDAFQQKPAAAIDYFRRKGLKVSWNWFDTWKDAHARAFTVAKTASLDVVGDIRDMVGKALSEGMTLAQFKKELKPQLQKKGWWGKKERVNEETGEIEEYMAGSPRRLRTIYETNLQTAYMAGRYKGQMEATDDLPYLQYIAVIDGKTTDKCREMHERVFRADDPVWNEFYPPNHWGCRARVRSLSEKMLERKGLTAESSDGRIVTQNVTVGKDANGKPVSKQVSGLKLSNGGTFWAGPGWNYNPGSSLWMPDLNGYDTGDASAFIKGLLASSAYKMWIGAEGKIAGTIPVGVLPKEYVKAVGGEKQVVVLTHKNYKSHRTSKEHYHPDIGVKDYQEVQSIIEDADLVVTESKGKGPANTLLFIKRTDDADFYVVPVRPDSDGRPEMRSLYRVDIEEAERYKEEAISGKNGQSIIKDGLLGGTARSTGGTR
jgi:SPP1 gp7 family putative phage head morphogenesis protein